MKGKIAFVLGAAVGYVLGTRAGRERYVQIKQGAQALWNTRPVQRGVQSAQDALGSRVDELKATAIRAGKDAFTAFARGSAGTEQSATSNTAASETSSSAAQSKPSTKPQSGTKSQSSSKSQPGTKSKSGTKQTSKSKSSGSKSSGAKS